MTVELMVAKNRCERILKLSPTGDAVNTWKKALNQSYPIIM